ncbi:MAG: hypothetical protein HRT38_03860 [Alteromonadaceae bacterium]|nr:hypothetical protein [Alteromonadaceae bacterium]
MKYIDVKPTSDISSEELISIKLFKKRFDILANHRDELDIKRSGGFSASRDEIGKVTGDTLNKSENSMKGFFMDYRFFHGEKETTYYFKIAKLIGRKFKDERLFLLLKDQKSAWNKAETFHSFCGVKADELIDVLFNTHFFHSGKPDQIAANEIIKSKIDDKFQLKLLSDTIHDRINVLRNLCWIIEPLIKGADTVRLPEDYLNELQESARQKKIEMDIADAAAKLKHLEEKAIKEKALIQEKFNREKSFSDEIISNVKKHHYGYGYNAEEIANSIDELSIEDATGILNNIKEESRLRCEKAEELYRRNIKRVT